MDGEKTRLLSASINPGSTLQKRKTMLWLCRKAFKIPGNFLVHRMELGPMKVRSPPAIRVVANLNIAIKARAHAIPVVDGHNVEMMTYNSR